jgi:hypothetical protein
VRRIHPAVPAAAVVVLIAFAVLIGGDVLEPASYDTTSPSQLPATTAEPSAAPPDGSGAPSASLEPSLSFGPGDPALGGATWYPPVVEEGGYALVAALGSSAENRERADFVVEGTADDEINAALNSMAGSGGGQVLLLEGRYELAAPIIISGDGLALVGVNTGNGAGYAEAALGSQVAPAAAFPGGEFLIQATSDAYGPLISLIHVDGADRAQGINVEAIRPTVTLNAVTQSSGVGLRFAGQTTGRRPYDGFVLFNRVFDGLGVGILHDQRAGDMLIEGNVVFRNAGDGFMSRSASQMYRLNHAYNNGGVGIRLVPGCVRTRLSSNKWEGNALGGVSIEGGSAFTIVGDTFADNDNPNGASAAHIQLGVLGATETRGVMLSNLAFGKGDDGNPYLIHFGPLARDIHVGPVTSNGGYQLGPYLQDPGSEVQFYGPIPDPIVIEANP